MQGSGSLLVPYIISHLPLSLSQPVYQEFPLSSLRYHMTQRYDIVLLSKLYQTLKNDLVVEPPSNMPNLETVSFFSIILVSTHKEIPSRATTRKKEETSSSREKVF